LRGPATTVALAVTGALVAALTASPTPAYATPSFHTSVDPTTVRESIHYLTKTYGVTEREAIRRLELQNDARALDTSLRREAPDQYGGMWLDHDRGGVLVLAMTRTSAALPYLRGMPDRSHVTTRTVTYSLRALTAARDRIAAQVPAGPDGVFLPEVSQPDNRVVVWEREWVARQKRDGSWAAASGGGPVGALDAGARSRAVDAEVGAARSAVLAAGGMAVGRTLAEPRPLFTPNVDWGFCHPLYCPNPRYGPMRGGLRLDVKRDNGTWGGCTSGFNVRSTSGTYAGKAWVLTAGHCVINKTNNTPVQHNGDDVAAQHGFERNAYPYDYAVLPFLDQNRWLDNFTGRNRVLKYCRNGGMDSDADTPCGAQATPVDESVGGVQPFESVLPGAVVCATGTGSSAVNYPDSHDSGAGAGYLVGTRCGRVLSTDVGINTDICARRGDSGGPLFSQVDHTAYGILQGSQQDRSGPCASGELNDYAPVSKILWDVNHGSQNTVGTYGSTFQVISQPNG